MSICEDYPRPLQLVGNERITLRHLITHCKTAQFPKLHQKAGDALDKLRADIPILCFQGEWTGKCRDGVFDILVGADINATKNKYGRITYALCVRQNDLAYRQFHFDFNPSKNEESHQDAESYSHPFLHLQYGGSRAWQEVSDDSFKALRPELSSPRIPFPPVTLALLLDLGFREFGDDKIRKFRETSEWRGLVSRNEDFILRWYYEACSNHWRSRRGNQLFMDILYNE